MRITATPPEISDTEGFTKENDIFDLAEFGDRLANLVCAVDEPLVITIDGPWGSGKSTFIRQWAGLLRQRGVPVILFDAFANDYQEDAFIPLAAEINALANAEISADDKFRIAFIEKAKEVGRILLPFAIKASIHAITLGAIDAAKLSKLGTGIEEIAKAGAYEASKAMDAVVTERLRQADANRKTLSAFRSTLERLAELLSEQQLGESPSQQPIEEDSHGKAKAGPLVFIVDELDRCRPDFALSLLERMKHLFSVKGICFVLVTHLGQLEAMVRAAYGAEIDARTYLEKFSSISIRLPQNTTPDEPALERHVKYLWQKLGLNSNEPGYDGRIRAVLIELAIGYNLSLRTLERIVSTVALVYAATSSNNFRNAPLIAGLCVMRHVDPSLYARARAGTLTTHEAENFLGRARWRTQHNREWTLNWWRFATSDIDPQDGWAGSMRNEMFRYTLDRREILKLLSGYIEELQVV